MEKETKKENKKTVPDVKKSGVVIGQPTWQMALPTLIQAIRSEDEKMQQQAVRQFSALCMIVDKVWLEARDNDAFAKRIEHLNILMKPREEKDGK
jgi:hypothetical protein